LNCEIRVKLLAACFFLLLMRNVLAADLIAERMIDDAISAKGTRSK